MIPQTSRLRICLLLLGTLAASVHGMFPLKAINDRIKSIQQMTEKDLVARYEKRHEYPSIENVLHRVRLASATGALNLSTNCAFDVGQLVLQASSNVTNDFTFSYYNVLDAAGKPGSGLLRGHKFMYGLLNQCKAVKHTFSNGHTFKGNYVGLSFVSTLEAPSEENCNPGGIKSLTIDLCVPDSCSVADLTQIFALVNSTCAFSDIRIEDRGSVAGTYITTIIMCTCLFLGITASVYDYYLLPLHKNLAYTKSFPMKAWRSFSLYTNIVEIFNTKGSNKPGNIGPLHCMRFFSMVWIMTGHTIGFFMAFAINPLDVMAITHDWGTQIITSAYFAVDTFFWQGGLLLSYIWFKKYNQNKRQAMSPFNWVMFYVHRIIRLSPPYYILIAFFTWIFTRKWLTGMAPYVHGPLDHNCDSNWWIDFLYLNNFINYDKQCYLVSWYLSTDLQMYLFAPMVIVPFTFGKIPGLVSAFLIFAVSTGVNFYTVMYHYFPPTDYAQAKMDPRMTVDYSFYSELIYNAPWIRCQVYIIGLVTGYFMQNTKKLRIPFYVSVIGWSISAACAYGAIWSLMSWVRGNRIDIGYAALYSATSKVGWGMALSWIVVACYYGYGGVVNSFLSWSIWVPLGRLTYSAYLLHICVASYSIGINQQGLVYTSFIQMFTQFCIPCVVLSYFFAILWSSAFEFAFGKLEDALITVIMGAPRRPPVHPAAADGTEPKTQTNGSSPAAVPLSSDSLRHRNGNGELASNEAGNVVTLGLKMANKEDEAAWS